MTTSRTRPALKAEIMALSPKCRSCGCTDDDCRQCIQRTGEPCFWIEADLCSACRLPVSRAA